jgi:prepilin-type N-terminal cleavage/methylation domain-containing protein
MFAFIRPASSCRPRRSCQTGFTLVELLVVVGIIAVLISLLLPALNKAREASKAIVCQSNEHQLMMGFLMFANEHQGHLPGNYFDSVFQQPKDAEKRDWLLGDNRNQGNSRLEYLDGPQNGTIFRYIKDAKVYLCPSYEHGDGLNVGAESNGRFDYVAYTCFAGAKVARVGQHSRFHYRTGPFAGTYTYDVSTPIICEEDPLNGINGGNTEGGHGNGDKMGHYHRGGGHYASIDGSVQWFLEPKDHSSFDWETKAPTSGKYKSIAYYGIPGWGWWDLQ